MRRVPSDVRIMRAVRFWDQAATQDAGCFTAGGKLGVDQNGHFWILNMLRGQWDSARRDRIIRSTAEADGFEVEQGVEQEPGSSGVDAAKVFKKNLAGYRPFAEKPSGDKVWRADPFSGEVNSGNVSMVPGEWNEACIDELQHFPNSTFKDQVDALAGAYKRLTTKKIKVRGGA